MGKYRPLVSIFSVSPLSDFFHKHAYLNTPPFYCKHTLPFSPDQIEAIFLIAMLRPDKRQLREQFSKSSKWVCKYSICCHSGVFPRH